MSSASDPPPVPPGELPTRRARPALPAVPPADGPAAEASPGEFHDDNYSYGPGTVPWQPPDGRAAGAGGAGGARGFASSSGVSGGGAYHGPNDDLAGYGQRGPAAGSAGTEYQEPSTWFTPRARDDRGYPGQELTGDGYAGERYGSEPDRYPGEGYGG